MIILFTTLMLLLLLGAPVFVAIGGSSLLYMLMNGLNPLMVAQRMVAGLDSFALLAMPFFILAGGLMNASRVTQKLFDFANSMVAHWRGGLGHVNVYGSLIFSMMSGSAMADAAGLGAIQLREMKERGYEQAFSVGTTGATTVLAGIIPPSLALVVYAFVANVSVGRIFLAGVIPGLLCALFLHLAVILYAALRKMPTEQRFSWRARGRAFLGAIPAMMLPLIIIGSILAGIATPTEAAAIASAYALFLGMGVYRTLSLKDVLRVMSETFEITATLMIIVGAAMLFGWVLVYENVARDVTTAMLSLASEPWQVLAVIVVFLLLAGMFLDNVAVILLATPIITPTLQTYGIDLIQFGIIMVLVLMVGLLTPPVGMVLFVISRLSGMSYFRAFAACVPFLLPVMLLVVLIMIFPSLATWLHDLVYG